MNPVWAVFFKDRFKTPFSVYRMSFAEVVFLVASIVGVGWGLGKAAQWIIDVETTRDIVVETK